MQQQRATAVKYKGVRMREWGKWVTEIFDTQTKTRIWLGSFETEEMAARAYDSALESLRGPNAAGLNFPDSLPQFVSQSRAPKDIQAAAAQAAAHVSAPEVGSKKKKAPSSLSTWDSHTQEYTPHQGEPSAPKGSGGAATMEEIQDWIDDETSKIWCGPLRPPYLEVFDRFPYMPYEEDYPD
jgi:hypothetical protein